MGCDVVSFYPGDGYWDLVLRASKVLLDGGLLIFPTETVYGVAARGDDPKAIGRLRRVKQREDSKPFTVHIGRRDEVGRYVPNPGRFGRRLVRKGWPGPLTLLFRVPDPDAAPIASQVDRSAARALYHDGVVGLRCPDEDRARDVLNETSVPVVAASANIADQPAPRTIDQALRDLGDAVDLALDGGPTRLSVPSTIVRLEGDGFTVVRSGTHDERTLRKMVSVNVLFVCTGNTCRSPMAAALFRRMLTERLGGGTDALEAAQVTIHSAGMLAVSRARAAAEAVEVMAQRGIDLSSHSTVRLSAELINEADHIFAMTQEHRRRVTELVPSAGARCRLLCEEGVEDPMGGSVEVYAACADKLETSLRSHLDEVEL